jgi:hypothetical protein
VSAKLGPVTLSAQEAVEWPLAGGIEPVRATLKLTRERAERVPLGQALDYALPHQTYRRVYALAVHPADTPHARTVELADRRWLWPSIHVLRDFNLRRETGEVTLLGRRVENAQPKAEVRYMRHSLRNETTPWKAREVLVEVLTALVGGEFSVPSEVPEVEIEDLSIDGPGDEALAQVLAFIPGANVRIDPDGRVAVFFSFDQSERQALSGLAVHVGGDYPVLVDLDHVRPSAYRVLFSTETELRFDYTTSTRQRDALILENVLPVPDVEATIGSRTVGRGTWVTVDEYLDFLATQATPNGTAALTQADLRRDFLSGLQRVALNYTIVGGIDPLWQQRLSALRQHWRQTFRITPEWRDRLLRVEPFRAAVFDRESGMRAASEVFCSYLVRPSWRGIGVKHPQRKDTTHGWNVAGLPSYGTPLADAYPAPFRLVLVDPQAMVLHCEPVVDPWHEADAIAPGTADADKMPVNRPGEVNRTKELNKALWEWVELAETWSLALVLTGSRATPNGSDRLHAETVEAGELNKFFKPAPKASNGPVMELRISPGFMAAKYGWSDDNGEAIRGALLAGGPLPPSALLNGTHVRNVAVAMAACVHELMLNRVEGNFAVDARAAAGLKPTGSIGQVTHSLAPDGKLQAWVSASLPERARNLMTFLPAGTRKAILRTLYQQ